MRFVVVGCSIHTAPLDVREKLAFTSEELPEALRELTDCPEISEAMLVSTCNRVEIYATGAEAPLVEHACFRFIKKRRGIDADALSEVLFRHADGEALSHIFRVTSSLDALVVGEAQIMGQVKDAFALAREAGTVGPLLGRCLERAFFAAKRVRTDTEIARHPASVSSVAVDLAGRIFEDLSAVAVLIIGAGEMAELAGRHLLGHGTQRLRVANRSPERGEALARQLEGTAVAFETLEEQLGWADVVISSTGSPQPILDRALLQRVMKQRKQRPLLIVDIAVPRDVAADAKGLENLYLFDVDALKQVVGQNLKKRREEAKAAEKMVAGEVKTFEKWLHGQEAVPVIKQLRQHFSDVARAEAKKTAKKLKLAGKEEKTLQKLAEAIVAKLLHAPTLELKREGASSVPAHLAEAARELFQLAAEEGAEQAREEALDAATEAAAAAEEAMGGEPAAPAAPLGEPVADEGAASRG